MNKKHEKVINEHKVEHKEDAFQAPVLAGYFNPKDDQSGQKMSRSIDAYTGDFVSKAYFDSFDSILPGHSGRVQFTREDYEHFRPNEAVPKKYSDIVRAIDKVYYNLAIVRNIIDLMSDFSTEGIRLVHPVKTIERFYQDWFNKINGLDRSERFLSGIFRHGMVVVRHYDGEVKLRQEALSAEEMQVLNKRFAASKIPLKYQFYNPANFYHTNYHDIGAEPRYIYKKPKHINNASVYAHNSYVQEEEVEIGADKLYIDYYKKDDWNARPTPFLLPIVKHAMMLEKLNLADSAALDGAISKVRVFKLGSLEHELFPDEGAIEKFDQILRSNVAGGTIDLVTGPDVDLIESSTDVHQFLGKEKYEPHLAQVYEGLGIPASFVGGGQGTTNNYISLKVLMRRLVSGRERLISFWNSQIKVIQDQMGFAEPARIEFNHLDLGDEESERNMLIQLLDRDIISSEKVQAVLGFDPIMENKRIMKENKERDQGRRPAKVSSYHQPEKDFVLKKSAMERGYLAPEHVGVDREPGTEDVLTPQEVRNKVQKSGDPELSGGPGGRPVGSKDQEPRKTPAFKPKSKASLDIWLTKAQTYIYNELKEEVLTSFGKRNLREITTEQSELFEKLQIGVLFNIKAYAELNPETIKEAMSLPMSSTAFAKYQSIKTQEAKTLGRTTNLEENRILQKYIYMETLNEDLS